MPKIENGSRSLRAETDKTPDIWLHIPTDKIVFIIKKDKNRNIYESRYFRSRTRYRNGFKPDKVIARGRNKEQVRKKTFNWLKDHPMKE